MALGDPLHPQSWNRFAYAFNNPVAFVDRDGEFAASTILLAATVIGGFLAADAANAPGWDNRGDVEQEAEGAVLAH